MVLEVINEHEFKRILDEAGDKLVVVDFTATWCGPCQKISPIFEKQAEAKENQNVVFLKVDVDKAPEITKNCNVKCMPTFQFYKGGKKVFEFSGANEKTLMESLQKYR